jgi:hypothetical protein
MKNRSIICLSLTAIVWVAVCAALLNAGLARQFDPERDCNGSSSGMVVCH